MTERVVQVRRVLEETTDEAARILVDRVWPRGVSKQRARLDEWLKDVAPSTELRRWYGHVPARFDEFRRRYQAELAESPTARQAWRHLCELADQRPVILLTATKDVEHSQAAVLADRLTQR